MTIYFVRAVGTDGPIKIGYSHWVNARASALATTHKRPLEVLATLPGTQSDEAKFHRLFAAAARGGEWFDPVPGLLALVRHARVRAPSPEMVDAEIEAVIAAAQPTRVDVGGPFDSPEDPARDPPWRWKAFRKAVASAGIDDAAARAMLADAMSLVPGPTLDEDATALGTSKRTLQRARDWYAAHDRVTLLRFPARGHGGAREGAGTKPAAKATKGGAKPRGKR